MGLRCSTSSAGTSSVDAMALRSDRSTMLVTRTDRSTVSDRLIPQPRKPRSAKKSDVSSNQSYALVVIELDDIVPRIREDRPNVLVRTTTRTGDQLLEGLRASRYRPMWARGHASRVRLDLGGAEGLDRDNANQQRDELIRKLRQKGFTVNRNTTAYRTYVINLHNPQFADPGKGYVYVGQTSKTPELRLTEHLTGARSNKDINLASKVVQRFGKDLNYSLMPERIYLTKRQAEKAERRLAERLRDEGYVVEGGH